MDWLEFRILYICNGWEGDAWSDIVSVSSVLFRICFPNVISKEESADACADAFAGTVKRHIFDMLIVSDRFYYGVEYKLYEKTNCLTKYALMKGTHKWRVRMPERGTTNAIFILRQMAKYREKGRDLHMVFIDLDNVPREELWRCLREKMVPEKYVRLIKEMPRDVKVRVRSGVGTTESFEVKVGLHQGSALSPFLLNIVFDVLTRRVRRGVPWSMMYVDDVVLCGETSGEVERLLEEWRVALESRGMRISRTKTEYVRCTPWPGRMRPQNNRDSHF